MLRGNAKRLTLKCDDLVAGQSQEETDTAADCKPSIVILEQPASHQHRFRYDSEGGGAGVLYGETSNSAKKTFPKIKLVGCSGPAMVVVSCVTHDCDPPKAHPHTLISRANTGEGGCKKGVCTARVAADMTVEFPHLGIQCKRRRDVADALEERKSIRVDPYEQGFQHASSPSTIDLNAVRLCFQAFLEDPLCPGKFQSMVPPICSKPIFDAKAKKELQIMDISDTSSPAIGGKKIIILCERVSRDDIKVRFFQDDPKWESFGIFKPEDVHRQYAISFQTPPYLDPCLKEEKKVWVELTKQDRSSSEPVQFSFTPNHIPFTPNHISFTPNHSACKAPSSPSSTISTLKSESDCQRLTKTIPDKIEEMMDTNEAPRFPRTIIVPNHKILSTSTDHCSLPNLSPLLPPPKSELANPKCSKSQIVNQPNPSQVDTIKQKITQNAQADTADKADKADKATSTRLRPSCKKMRSRAKCLRVLSGRTLATESGVRLSMMGLAKLQWQANRLGYSLALTPARGKLIVMPKFKVVRNV